MKALKRIVVLVATLALTVGMCVSASAAESWGHYIGFDEGNTWYEASEGSFKLNSDTSWTATMNSLGWGGIWGYQVYKDAKSGQVKIEKGKEYQIKATLKSSDIDKWIHIKIATGDTSAYGKWIQLKKGQTYTLDETFTAAANADSIYFGLGGDFGDREDEKIAYQYATGGAKSIDDKDPTLSTVITCDGFYLGEPATGNAESGNKKPAVVSTGDFQPIAFGAIAILAAAAVVVFARKRENN